MRDAGSTRWRTRALALLAAVVLVAGGCSGDDAASDEGDGEGGGADAGGEAQEAGGERTCDRPVAEPPAAAEVAGAPSDRDVTSFDGTQIRVHWFPLEAATPEAPAPTILMGPGWGQAGDTNVGAEGAAVLGATSIAGLRESGFHVLTWDPRGFGASGGTVQVNGPDAEARDVQSLLDWVAAQPGVQLDADGDPRAGMVGGSYGGGIQTVTAATDCRVDALVPVMAWHSLRTSLYKADTPKIGWAGLLTRITEGRSIDPHVTRAAEAMNAGGTIDPEDAAWFEDRGPGDLVEDIAVPTLLVQGTVDTLFTLDEAVTTYRALRDNDVPVGMLWWCGGHGSCLSGGVEAQDVQGAATAWLRRYVAGDDTVDTGPRFSFVDQDGGRYTADDYPLATAGPIVAEGSGTLDLVAEGGAGPVVGPPAPDGPDLLRSLVLPITPAPAANAVEVPIPAPDAPALVVGAPQLTLSYTGTAGDAPAGDDAGGGRPTRVFAQLVDEASGLTVGNQVTPIAVTLDGEAHTVEVPLEIVAHAVRPDSRLALQLVATTVAYAPPLLGGSVTFDAVEVSLPVAEGLVPAER